MITHVLEKANGSGVVVPGSRSGVVAFRGRVLDLVFHLRR